MTETQQYILIGKNGKSITLIAPKYIDFPSRSVIQFSSFCGAGKGFGDTIVPESIWGLPISPACYIHDKMWAEADATWEAFHAANSIFLRNLIALIDVQSSNRFSAAFRRYRAVTYYNAVDTFGSKIFWKLKERQKNEKSYRNFRNV